MDHAVVPSLLVYIHLVEFGCASRYVEQHRLCGNGDVSVETASDICKLPLFSNEPTSIMTGVIATVAQPSIMNVLQMHEVDIVVVLIASGDEPKVCINTHVCAHVISCVSHSMPILPCCVSTDHTSDNMTRSMVRTRQDSSSVQKELYDTGAVSTGPRDEGEQCPHQTTADPTTLTKIKSSGLSGSIHVRNVTATSDAYQVVANTGGYAIIAENIRASRGATQIIGTISRDTFEQIMQHHKLITLSNQSDHSGDEIESLSLR